MFYKAFQRFPTVPVGSLARPLQPYPDVLQEENNTNVAIIAMAISQLISFV